MPNPLICSLDSPFHILSSWLHQLISPSFFFLLKIFFIYLFLDRGGGREKERERNIDVWSPLTHPLLGTCPASQACALTGNWPFGLQASTQSTELHQPGLFLILYTSSLLLSSQQHSPHSSVSWVHGKLQLLPYPLLPFMVNRGWRGCIYLHESLFLLTFHLLHAEGGLQSH